MPRTTRRRFLQASSAIGASFFIGGTKSSGNILGANDRLRIAVIGLNGRGGSHINGWKQQKNVEIAYVVDPD
ncbi:MAG TPA: dehydrogenase, partial [Planctomycetaceae bacterium]|nr:dehydrogenase [Planctomycetaceae bacterium]